MNRKHFLALSLAAFAAILFGCVGDGIDTIVLPERDRGSTGADVPSSVIPNSIRTGLGSTMPIYSGTTPPNITGQYRANDLKQNSSGGGGGSGGGNGTGTITDLYLDFSSGANGECTLSYKETRDGVQYGGNNIKGTVVGSGDNFSVYFTTPEGQSYVISGTRTSNGGISNLYYAIVTPNDASCGCTSYRSFKDGDGYTEGYMWNNGGSKEGEVPPNIIPPAIRDGIENYMTIYDGTNPPDISGQYRISSSVLAGSSISGDNLNNLADMYIAFVKGSNGVLSYREEQNNSQAGGDNVVVEIVGSGNNFTAYFETIGESNGIMTKTATLISGTLTSSGISNIRYAFVMLEKGPDPSNKLVPVNTYRVFKDGDGLAERYNWLAASSSSSTLGSSSSVAQSSSSAPSSSGGSTQVNVVYGDDVLYEGVTYKTVVIGGKTWFQRNLNYAVTGSKCGSVLTGLGTVGDANTATCDTYGRLYDWATAMALPSKCNSKLSTSEAECAIATPNHRGICPSGWHIPSDADWNVLMKVANPSCSDNSNCAGAGKKLKADSGWNENGNGTDDFGFSALPGGYGISNGYFYDVGYYGLWWSASEDNSDYAYYRYMSYDYENVVWYNNDKGGLFSVRCLQD